MDIMGYMASALGGSLLTAFVFIFAFTSKIEKMAIAQKNTTDNLKILSDRFDQHVQNTPTCSFHNEINRETATAAAQLVGLEGRISSLEKKV